MDLFLLKERKTGGIFNSKPIPPDVLSEILNCARITPIDNNNQDWKFVAITDNNIKQELFSVTGFESIKKAQTVVAFFVEQAPLSVEYACCATEAMVIAANFYKVGIFRHLTNNQAYNKRVNSLLNAPNRYNLVALISLGYYDYAPPNICKMPSLSHMVEYEKFK
jgi:nitroreductase